MPGMTSRSSAPNSPKGRNLDGRLLRSERTRKLMIDAYLQLVQQTGSVPTAAEVADQSGYALRSVFERFSTLDELSLAAVDHALTLSRAEMQETAFGTDRSSRIAHHISVRSRLCEEWSPLWHALNALSAQTGRTTFVARVTVALDDNVAWLERLYQPELRQMSVVDQKLLLVALVTLTSTHSWHQMHHGFALSVREVRDAWSTAIGRLLP